MKVEYRPASSIPQSLPEELGVYKQLISLFMVLRSIDEKITSHKSNSPPKILIYELKTATPPISVPTSAIAARL